jgi:acyl-CoA dehydrogenase
MDFNLSQEQVQIRDEIRKVCREFPDAYWREIDGKKEYPETFVRKLSELGWLAALIPEEYGGTGLGITEASIILEEINRSGGVATACHAQRKSGATCRKSPAASSACKLSASPSLMPARNRRGSRRRRREKAIVM